MTGRPDFPYYNGEPTPVDGRGWLILMAALALAFAALVLLPLRSFPLSLAPPLLFLGIPLAALRLVTGPHWLALFRPVGLRDLGLMVLFAVIALVGSVLMGLLLAQKFQMTPNPVASAMGAMSAPALIARLLPTVPQLVGEELLGILPFLAVLWFCVTRLRLSRWVGIVFGLIISALVFGAAHLPTYDWNWAQALLGIGFGRILLTLAFLVTRNLWVSAGAHILNDWTEFLAVFGAGHLPIGTE